MAQFETDDAAIRDMIHRLSAADLFTEESQERILKAGAQTLADAEARAARGRHRRTGVMAEHVTVAKKIRQDKYGYLYATVTVSGSVARGKKRKIRTRNAVKAFVNNYGRRSRGAIPASYFWTWTAERSRGQCTQTMQEEVNALLKEKGAI